MSAEIQLRIRGPEGTVALNSLKENSTIGELKQQIAALVKAKPLELVLRAGYPPSAITHPDKTRLIDAEITSGETIIVEIHEPEETKVEQKPAVSKETKADPKTEPVKTSSAGTQQKSLGTIAEEKPISQQPPKYSTNSRLAEEKPKPFEEKPKAFEQPAQQYSKYTSDFKIVDEKPKIPEQKPKVVEDKTRVAEEKSQAYSLKDKRPEIPTRANETSSVLQKNDLQSYTSKTNPTTKYPTNNVQNNVSVKNAVLDKKYIVDEPHLRPKDSSLTREVVKESITKKTEIPTKPAQKDYRSPFYEIKNDNRDAFRQQKKIIDDQKKSTQKYPQQHELSQEDLDSELARAMQESLDLQSDGGQKISKPIQNDKISKPADRYDIKDRGVNKSNAPVSYTSKTGKPAPEKTTSSNLNKKGSQTKDLDTKLDEEYARSLQTQLYQGNEYEDPELARHKKSHRHQKNQQPRYEAPEFYDITKQYNEENNLPTDPPLQDEPLYNPGRTDFSEFNQLKDEDDLLQKAIQESLMQSKGGKNPMNDTLNDDTFKKILEKSKREK